MKSVRFGAERGMIDNIDIKESQARPHHITNVCESYPNSVIILIIIVVVVFIVFVTIIVVIVIIICIIIIFINNICSSLLKNTK